MRRVSIKGVLIGSIAEIAASIVFLSLVFIVIFLHSGRTAYGTFHRHPAAYLLLEVSGLVFSAFGGYLAAWVAKHDELLNGGLSSFLCVLSSLFQILAGRSTYTAAFLTLAAVPACGVLGGYLRITQKAS